MCKNIIRFFYNNKVEQRFPKATIICGVTHYNLWQGGKEMLKQLNDTINYIEEHLLDEGVIDEAMKRVSVSELHFKTLNHQI